MNYNPEILVVDDEISAAKDYAKLVQDKLGINTIACDEQNEAIRIVKDYNIKVAILDQVMPKKTGNELLKDILLLKPDIKSLLLTGEATSEQVGTALNTGFKKYLGKSNIADLCSVVLDLYQQYELDILAKYNLPAPVDLILNLSSKMGLVKYYLISCDPIKGSEKLDKSQSSQLVEIFVGEEKEYETGISLNNDLVIESSIEAEITSNLSLSANALKTLEEKLNAVISKQYKVTTTKSASVQERSRRKIKLPDQSPDVKETYITRRTIDQVPYYQDYRVIIKSVCRLCHCTKVFAYIISKPTGKYQLIQTDYLSDGTPKVIPIGEAKK